MVVIPIDEDGVDDEARYQTVSHLMLVHSNACALIINQFEWIRFPVLGMILKTCQEEE